MEDTDPSTISLNTVGYAFYINSDDLSFFSPPLFLVLDSVLVLHMSGVFFLDYVRSLSTCLFKYVFFTHDFHAFYILDILNKLIFIFSI